MRLFEIVLFAALRTAFYSSLGFAVSCARLAVVDFLYPSVTTIAKNKDIGIYKSCFFKIVPSWAFLLNNSMQMIHSVFLV
ncbi:MAG: hypothetical protein LBG21_07225, partial [Campylobacteraceae bacterium]|nr:hypothetical protein [Campylobacteraceae bacterium]